HFFFFQAEDGIRDRNVTGVQTCALPISRQSMIKQKANDYYQVIEREHAKTLRKIDKLKEDLSEAKEKDKYQKYGELITAYMHTRSEERRVGKECGAGGSRHQ